MSRSPASAETPEPGAATRRPLLHAMGVSAVDFRCRAHVHPAGGEEPNGTHSIVFVRRGVFARSSRHGTVVADANHVLFFNQGEPYRFAHPLPGGDDCTILALDDEAARQAVGNEAGPDGPFRAGHGISTPRAARLHFELLAACRGVDAPDPLAAQEVIAELVEEALGSLPGAPASVGPGSPAVRRRRLETVEEAKLVLHRRLARPPSLADLGGALGCSPFHLSRIFHAETGLRLRQYLRRLRVRIAAERLAHGATDLTALALDLGFYDHSHFTSSFRKEWGVPPSRLRGR